MAIFFFILGLVVCVLGVVEFCLSDDGGASLWFVLFGLVCLIVGAYLTSKQ